MRIGIDLDGVLTDESSFIKDYGCKYCYENHIANNMNISIYDSKETLGVNEKEYQKFWDDYLEYYSTNSSVRPFASEVLRKLRDNNHEILIITSRNLAFENSDRGEKMRNIVKAWLDKYEISYDEIYFAEEKLELCKSLNLDYMIDDKPANIINISKFAKVICYHDYCNLDIEGKNIIRCYGWYDILEKLENAEK